MNDALGKDFAERIGDGFCRRISFCNVYDSPPHTVPDGERQQVGSAADRDSVSARAKGHSPTYTSYIVPQNQATVNSTTSDF
jgi:hypothetical protein